MRGRALAATERIVCLASPGSNDAVDRLVEAVQSHDVTLVIREVGDQLQETDWTPGATLGVAVGGDGTFLSGVQAFAPRSIPFLGVDTGTLGFLARIQPADLPAALDAALGGTATVRPLRRFRVTARAFEATGINEVSVELPMPEDPVGRKVCRLAVETERESLGEYEGTGLAVTAPTGSTAMGLSAGGPIHGPGENDTLQIVPLHTNRVGSRPVVLDADREIRIHTGETVRVTVDGGRPREFVDGGSVLTVTGDPAPALLVETPQDRPFFDALADRLGWGARGPTQGRTRSTPTSRPKPRTVARESVCGAGHAIRAASGEDWTDEGTFRSAVTRRSEQVLTRALGGAFPDHGIRLAGTLHRPATGSYAWQGTPLDGGANLYRGAPQYAVGVTLLDDEAGESVVSAVSLPGFGELLLASSGRPVVRIDTPADAEWDGEQRTSRVGPTVRTEISSCRFLVGDGPGLTSLDGIKRSQIQRLGCDTLAVTQVATGRADACFLPAPSRAVGPALRLLDTAGGQATTLDGTALWTAPEEQSLVVSNGAVHQAFRRRVQASL